MRKVAVVLALVLLVAVPVPRADAGLWWLLIPLAENILNRKATQPMDQSTAECRVTANASWEGKTYGTQCDLNHWVIGVRRGAVVTLDAVLVAKPGLTKVVAAEIHCNDPSFPTLKAVAMPRPDRHGRVFITANTLYVTESGAQIDVPTAGLGFKGYTLQVDLFFTNGQRQKGTFGTGRVPYSDSTRTLVQLVVMDDEQITARVNDPGIQKALQWSFGLQPSVPQVGPTNIPLTDETTERMLGQPPTTTQQYQPQPQYQQPQPTPQPQNQPQTSQWTMPPAVQKIAQTAGWRGGKAWYEPCTLPRPGDWSQGPHCSLILFFVNGRGQLIYDDMDQRLVKWWINGERMSPNFTTNLSKDGMPGIVYERVPANSRMDLEYRGQRYSFQTVEGMIQWQPIRVQ